MAKRLNPYFAFPEEVVQLHEQGVPWPTWYCGPLLTGDVDQAVKELVAERDSVLAARGQEP